METLHKNILKERKDLGGGKEETVGPKYPFVFPFKAAISSQLITFIY
jgi:hypothetical protein